jgi:hypothetical protein
VNPWLESRLANLTLRLDQRLSLDPDLRHLNEEDVRGHGSLAESQRQELNVRLYEVFRSEFTYAARHEIDPELNDMRATFLENPFLQLFSIDSSRRRGRDRDDSATPPSAGSGAAPASIGGPPDNPVQGWVETLAKVASDVVPGKIDVTSSMSLRRYRFGAELQPLLYRDLPAPLRGITIKASREYQDYLRNPEVVDRAGCWMDCFATQFARGKLVVEHVSSRDDRTTRLGLVWTCML